MRKEETIDYCLRTTWQSLCKMYNEQASKYDTTMTTAFVLLSIDRNNGTRSTDLGPKLGMEPTSLSRTLKDMEGRELIFREKNPKDKRSVLIKLTDLGVEKRELSKTYVLKFNDTIKEHISDEKLKHFFEVSEEINRLIVDKLIFDE
ncbi:MarR family winged helix-turn-helix transcriptional regulator [Aureivirga sp. CE67]|uniref:MarR family winged helix-turn-helix transcriptional regulator n=1 Tax=Aureivirga sp. CE67 TaxID=1788983 RepID=UPI0018C8F1BA|nr:MarR family transcriptional regulator [Aureivirga sp. CE67]